MTKGKLSDLNDHLFAQLDRLKNADDDQIEAECHRATAIVDIADQIIDVAKLQLDAARLYAEHGDRMLPMLPAIGNATDAPAIAARDAK